MRGSRNFRKLIQRMPSGRFSWNLLNTFGTRIDGGLAHSYREARRKAQLAERGQLIHVPRAMPATPAYAMRNQNRDCVRTERKA